MTQKKFLSPRTSAWIVLAIGIFVLSFSSIIMKKTSAPMSIFLFYRMLFSIIIIFPLYYRSHDKKVVLSDFSRKSLKLISVPFIAGLIKGIDYIFAGTSVKLTTVANSTILINLAPVWCAVISCVAFGEKLHFKQFIGALIAFGGLTVIFHTQKSFRINRGEIYAVLSSIFYGSYFIAAQKGREYLGNIEFYFLMIVATGLFFLIFNIVIGADFVNYPKEEWILFWLSGLLCQVIGHISLTYALGTLSANTVTVSMLLQPIITTILASIIIKESLNLLQWSGIFIVLLGIYIVNTGKVKYR